MTHRIEHLKRLLVALGLAGLVTILVAAPIVAQSGDFTVGIAAADEITAFIDSASLGSVPYSFSDQLISGTLVLTVDDQRGTSAGWTVTVQSSDLAYSGAANGANIPASGFALTNPGSPQTVSGQAIDKTSLSKTCLPTCIPVHPKGGPKVPAANSTGALDSPRAALKAANGYGNGMYTQNLGVTLTLPGGSKPGTYTATMTVSTSAAP